MKSTQSLTKTAPFLSRIHWTRLRTCFPALEKQDVFYNVADMLTTHVGNGHIFGIVFLQVGAQITVYFQP